MLLHYIKMAVRQLLKYKLHTIVSMLCMGIGLTINGYINLSLKAQFSGPENEIQILILDSHVKAVDYKQLEDKRIEGIENLRAITYNYSPKTSSVFIDDKYQLPYEVYIIGMNPTYMRTRNSMEHHFYKIIEGRDSIGNNEVIVSLGFARRVFGKESAIGKNVTVVNDSINDINGYTGHTYRIVGVINDGRRNVTPYIYAPLIYDNSYVSISGNLTEGYTIADVIKRINNAGLRQSNDGTPLNFTGLMPNKKSWEERVAIVIITLLSWLIFIIGFVNFMKFMIQMFYARQRELALRKCMGSNNKGLYILLACEVISMLVCAFVTSCLTSELSLIYLNYMNIDLGNIITLPMLLASQLEATLIATAIALAVIMFPIIKLRRIDMKGAMLHRRQGTKMRNTMLALQFAISIIFFVILGSMIFISDYDNGWYNDKLSKKEQQSIIWVPQYKRNWDEIRTQIENLPLIDNYAYCNTETRSSNNFYWHECTIDGDTAYTGILAHGDPQYFNLFNIKMSGKIVSPDDGNYVYIDRSMHERLQQSSTFNGNVTILSKTYQVAGVIEDDLFPHKKKAYLGHKGEIPICGFVFLADNTYDTFYYRIKEGYTADEAKDAIEEIVHKYMPESYDVRENIKTVYEKDMERMKEVYAILHVLYLIVFVCLLVVVLSVYSSISLDAATRQKEIAVRKINGARSHDIISHFIIPYLLNYVITFIVVYPFMANFMLLQIANGNGSDIVSPVGIAVHCIATFVITVGMLLLTTWHKIKLIIKVNPAEMIRRE